MTATTLAFGKVDGDWDGLRELSKYPNSTIFAGSGYKPVGEQPRQSNVLTNLAISITMDL